MAIRREDSASKLQDFQIGSSWIPATPTKPGPPSQLSIDTNQSVRSTLADWTAQANVSESESITENFLQEFDSWQAREGANSRVYGEKSCIYNNFPINAAEQWTNMPFGKLLALAEANVGNKTAIENTLTHHFATSSSSASYFHQQTEGGQFTVSIGDSSERDQCSLLAANFDAESKISDFVSNGSSTPWNFFNLDSPPRTIAGAALAKSALSQVEPVTPEKTNKEYVMKDTSIEEVPANKENEVTTGVMELHEKKDTNQLCEATSTKLQENHKPDKGVSEEASLSKTPQQKTRRKKHRPKVIIEGQQRRTPKSSAEKPSVAQKTTRAKRNYVRKNGANTPEDNMDKGTPETTDMKTPRQHSQRSCRRSLNFDSDGQMRDGSSTYFPSPNCDKVSQAENFDAKDQPRATPCMQEMGVVLRKDDMVTSHEVSNSMNQVHEEYSQLTFGSLGDSICSSPCLTPEKQVRGLKRQSACTTVEAELCSRNETGIFYNSLQAYRTILFQNADKISGTSGLHFPVILQLPSSQAKEMDPKSGLSNCQPIIEEPSTPEPIIEMPATPEPDLTQVPECDIESAFCEDPDEIPTIQLNMEEFTHNLQTFMQQNSELQEGDMSKALVALTSAAASIPGETMNSIEPPERRCISQEFEGLCSDETVSERSTQRVFIQTDFLGKK